MELLTPGIGLIFWQIVVFLCLVFVLKRYAWRPILGALRTREEDVAQALAQAQEAQSQVKAVQADNARLHQEALAARDALLKQAREAAERLTQEAQAKAEASATQILTQAQNQIAQQQAAARAQINELVVDLSMQISQLVLRQELLDTTNSEALSKRYLADIQDIQAS